MIKKPPQWGPELAGMSLQYPRVTVNNASRIPRMMAANQHHSTKLSEGPEHWLFDFFDTIVTACNYRFITLQQWLILQFLILKRGL